MVATSDTRTRLYGTSELSGMMTPRSVAVVGASEKPGAFGGQILKNLALNEGVRRYAVNPRAESVYGVPSFPNLTAIGEPVDVVAICVPRDAVVAVAREALSVGIRNAVIYSSGFGESGTPEGLRAQEELVELSEQGLRILGPNCLGFINAYAGTEMEFVVPYAEQLVKGGIGVVAQSGALGFVLTQAMFDGVGFSFWAAPGNSVDVDALDLANFMLEDENTKAVVMVFEGTSNGERILELGRRAAAAGKPVIVHKLGQSQIGAAGARSHTGVLAGSNAVFHEAFERAGLVVVDHYDQLLEVAGLFAKAGRASSSGVGVFSASGGAAIMAADEAELEDVSLPPLEPAVEQRLLDILPGFGSVGNPADVTAEAVKDSQMFTDALQTFASDDKFAIVIVTLTVAQESMTGVRSRVIADFVAGRPDHATPIATLWLSPWVAGPGYDTLMRDPKVPVFRSLRTAMSAFRMWIRWSEFDGRSIPTAFEYLPDAAASDAAAFAEGRADGAEDFVDAETGTLLLDESESKQVISKLGIPTSSPQVLALDDPALESKLSSLQFPVVAKVISRKIAHKARVGGVKLGLTTPEEVRDAVADFAGRFDEQGTPASTLVERMVASGREWFIGGRRDAAFGVILTIGLGGTDVEGRKPVMLIGSPSAAAIAARLDDSGELLGGALDGKPGVRDALVTVAERTLQLFAGLEQLSEIDINPLIETGDGLIAVDAAIIVNAGSRLEPAAV